MSSVNRVRIVLNLLVNMVNRRGQISLADAAKMFDLDEASLSEVVKVLVDKGVLTIEYSAEGEKIIKKGSAIESTIYHKDIKDKVDSVLDSAKVEEMDVAQKAEELLDTRSRKKSPDDENAD
jgi:DNA-binding Lrp family transcriptional regulator